MIEVHELGKEEPTDYEKFKAAHPWLLQWAEFKLAVSCWWYKLWHRSK